MTTFDEREKAFEGKYKRDQELQFKVTARRNRLLGEWAAAKMGLTGEAATEYAKAVVAADFDRPGDEDVAEKVVADLTAKKVAISAGDVRKEMDRLLTVAKEMIMKQGKPHCLPRGMGRASQVAERPRPVSNTRCSRQNANSSAPMTMRVHHELSDPSKLISVWIVPRISTPNSVPAT